MGRWWRTLTDEQRFNAAENIFVFGFTLLIVVILTVVLVWSRLSGEA